jgi:hypothetical protein
MVDQNLEKLLNIFNRVGDASEFQLTTDEKLFAFGSIDGRKWLKPLLNGKYRFTSNAMQHIQMRKQINHTKKGQKS